MAVSSMEDNSMVGNSTVAMASSTAMDTTLATSTAVSTTSTEAEVEVEATKARVRAMAVLVIRVYGMKHLGEQLLLITL